MSQSIVEVESATCCELRMHVERVDGEAWLWRPFRGAIIPRVGDTMVLHELDDYTCNRVEFVYHHDGSIFVCLESDSFFGDNNGEVMAPDDMLDEAVQYYTNEGWNLADERRTPIAEAIGSENFASLPELPRYFAIEDDGITVALIESDDARISLISESRQHLPLNELDKQIASISPEARDRLVKRWLIALRKEGRLSWYFDSRETVNSRCVAVKVVIVNGNGDVQWEDIMRLHRVPAIGESVQIQSECYRVHNVMHVEMSCGHVARIICAELN